MAIMPTLPDLPSDQTHHIATHSLSSDRSHLPEAQQISFNHGMASATGNTNLTGTSVSITTHNSNTAGLCISGLFASVVVLIILSVFVASHGYFRFPRYSKWLPHDHTNLTCYNNATSSSYGVNHVEHHESNVNYGRGSSSSGSGSSFDSSSSSSSSSGSYPGSYPERTESVGSLTSDEEVLIRNVRLLRRKYERSTRRERKSANNVSSRLVVPDRQDGTNQNEASEPDSDYWSDIGGESSTSKRRIRAEVNVGKFNNTIRPSIEDREAIFDHRYEEFLPLHQLGNEHSPSFVLQLQGNEQEQHVRRSSSSPRRNRNRKGKGKAKNRLHNYQHYNTHSRSSKCSSDENRTHPQCRCDTLPGLLRSRSRGRSPVAYRVKRPNRRPSSVPPFHGNGENYDCHYYIDGAGRVRKCTKGSRKSHSCEKPRQRTRPCRGSDSPRTTQLYRYVGSPVGAPSSSATQGHSLSKQPHIRGGSGYPDDLDTSAEPVGDNPPQQHTNRDSGSEHAIDTRPNAFHWRPHSNQHARGDNVGEDSLVPPRLRRERQIQIPQQPGLSTLRYPLPSTHGRRSYQLQVPPSSDANNHAIPRPLPHLSSINIPIRTRLPIDLRPPTVDDPRSPSHNLPLYTAGQQGHLSSTNHGPDSRLARLRADIDALIAEIVANRYHAETRADSHTFAQLQPQPTHHLLETDTDGAPPQPLPTPRLSFSSLSPQRIANPFHYGLAQQAFHILETRNRAEHEGNAPPPEHVMHGRPEPVTPNRQDNLRCTCPVCHNVHTTSRHGVRSFINPRPFNPRASYSLCICDGCGDLHLKVNNHKDDKTDEQDGVNHNHTTLNGEVDDLGRDNSHENGTSLSAGVDTAENTTMTSTLTGTTTAHAPASNVRIRGGGGPDHEEDCSQDAQTKRRYARAGALYSDPHGNRVFVDVRSSRPFNMSSARNPSINDSSSIETRQSQTTKPPQLETLSSKPITDAPQELSAEFYLPQLSQSSVSSDSSQPISPHSPQTWTPPPAPYPGPQVAEVRNASHVFQKTKVPSRARSWDDAIPPVRETTPAPAKPDSSCYHTRKVSTNLQPTVEELDNPENSDSSTSSDQDPWPTRPASEPTISEVLSKPQRWKPNSNRTSQFHETRSEFDRPGDRHEHGDKYEGDHGDSEEVRVYMAPDGWSERMAPSLGTNQTPAAATGTTTDTTARNDDQDGINTISRMLRDWQSATTTTVAAPDDPQPGIEELDRRFAGLSVDKPNENIDTAATTANDVPQPLFHGIEGSRRPRTNQQPTTTTPSQPDPLRAFEHQPSFLGLNLTHNPSLAHLRHDHRHEPQTYPQPQRRTHEALPPSPLRQCSYPGPQSNHDEDSNEHAGGDGDDTNP